MISIERPMATLLRYRPSIHYGQLRTFSMTQYPRNNHKSPSHGEVNVEELLAKPTWSARTLLPQKDTTETPEITSKQLHHLLRLSALPPPKSPEEEQKMLQTLSSQLHFVKEIQRVDTTGVEPLRSLRDETAAGGREAEVGMETLKEALENEEVVGKHHRRIRRKTIEGSMTNEKWNVLGTASKKVGRFFVVDGGKNG